jgi:predicted enzyme related to lactoylglutathione lyase
MREECHLCEIDPCGSNLAPDVPRLAAGETVMHISYVNVFVTDLDKAIAFYRGQLRQPWGGFMAMISNTDGNVFYLDQVSAVHGA